LGVVPFGRARCHEELRDLAVVQVFPEGRVVGGAEALEDEGDLVLLDEAADLLDRLGRGIAVIEADELDLAPVDAALLVDHVEIGGLGLADRAIGRGRPAIGHGLADLDLLVGDAGRVALLRERNTACGDERQADDERQCRPARCGAEYPAVHAPLPWRRQCRTSPPGRRPGSTLSLCAHEGQVWRRALPWASIRA